MAQTTGAMNTVDGVIHVSANGTTWVDISGSTNKVVPSVQEADTGEAATLEGQYMVGTTGKLKPMDIEVTVLYTENAGEAYAFFQTQNAIAGRPIWVRWSPKGTSGAARYTTANASGAVSPGKISAFAFPSADASEAAPALMALKVRCTTVVRSVVTPSASLSPSASASPSASLSPSASPSAGG